MQFENWKLFDDVIAPFEQSYVELAAFLALCIFATAALVVRRRRQLVRFLIQALSLFVFFHVVSSCLGVFGLIRNGFLGLRLLSQQDDLGAFYWLSMTVIALSAAFVGGAVFCGWICPTGTLQEWAGWLRTKLTGKSERSGQRKVLLVAWIGLVAGFLVIAHNVFSARRPILEDSATLWAGSLAVLVALVLISPRFGAALKRFRVVSLLLILGFTLAGISVFSPVHFIFMNVQDWASLLSGVLIVGAGFFALRAWCRFLCPFGIICGAASKYAVFQIEKGGNCDACGVCNRVCEVEAVENGRIDNLSCIACMKCVDHCPTNTLALVARPFGDREERAEEPARP